MDAKYLLVLLGAPREGEEGQFLNKTHKEWHQMTGAALEQLQAVLRLQEKNHETFFVCTCLFPSRHSKLSKLSITDMLEYNQVHFSNS